MSWLHIGREPPCTCGLDAALARNLEAQHRSGQAADDVAHAADDQRVRIQTATENIKARETRRVKANRPVRTSEVRSLVEEMLAQTQAADGQKGNRQ